jgi:hypothetical protein
MQVYRRRLIAYSLGNLTGWHNFGTAGNTGISALLRADVAPGGRFLGGHVTSLRLDARGVPHRDSSRHAERLMRFVSHADFGASSAFGRGAAVVSSLLMR